jgi:glycerol-3-phosphate dehydrogenase (NAD(P)+)
VTNPSVGIVGGGPWGKALAKAARRAGAEVVVHTRREQDRVDDGVTVTVDYASVARAPLVVLAVPSSMVRPVLAALGNHLTGQHLVVHGIRGLGAESLETVSDMVRDETAVRRVGALGGPVQAAELIRARPSAMIIGSRYPEVITAVTQGFQSAHLRVWSTHDLKGLEWASALVGCLSIGVGFAEQAGAGPGLVAALISRGVDEAAQIMVAAGGEERTMLGLGGYGDLLASIALEDRPEVVLGKALAQGVSLDEALKRAQLRVEAVPLIPKIVKFAEDQRVQATTFRALCDVLHGARPEALLERVFSA